MATFEELEKRVENLDLCITVLRRAVEIAASGPCDMRLDGDYSDPEIRVQPRDVAETVKGRHMSACSISALVSVAGFFDWAAAKEEKEGKEYNGKPTAPGTRKRAALARGWALAKILGLKPDSSPTENKPTTRAPAPPPAFKPPPPPAATRYGTSVSGASAKHTAPMDDDLPPDDEIPF